MINMQEEMESLHKNGTWDVGHGEATLKEEIHSVQMGVQEERRHNKS